MLVRAEVRSGSRLCENAFEPRTLRIVFSIAFCQQHLPVRLLSATMKSRWKFYAQVQCLSFHTAWVKSGPWRVLERCPLYPDEQTSASASISSEKCQNDPYLIRSSAAPLPSVCKSRVRATIRTCPPSRSLALPVARELTQPRKAEVSTLQAVRIIVGVVWLSGCR